MVWMDGERQLIPLRLKNTSGRYWTAGLIFSASIMPVQFGDRRSASDRQSQDFSLTAGTTPSSKTPRWLSGTGSGLTEKRSPFMNIVAGETMGAIAGCQSDGYDHYLDEMHDS